MKKVSDERETMTGNRLTDTQWRYLQAIVESGPFRRGWGGFSSTQTVRTLEEWGYIRLDRVGTGWEASSTERGRVVIAISKADVVLDV